MEWYIILLIGLLPFVISFIMWGIEEFDLFSFLGTLFLLAVWITSMVAAFSGDFAYVKSPDPITPELRITVKDSVQDTLYIYR